MLYFLSPCWMLSQHLLYPKHCCCWRERNKASPQVDLSQQNHLMAIPTPSVSTRLKMLRVNTLPCSRSSSRLQNNFLLPHRHADQLHSLVSCWLLSVFWLWLFLDLLAFWCGTNQKKKECCLYVTLCIRFGWWMKLTAFPKQSSEIDSFPIYPSLLYCTV